MDQHLRHLLFDYNKKYLLLETHLYHSCLDPECLPHINEELDINHSVFVMKDTVIALKVHWISNPDDQIQILDGSLSCSPWTLNFLSACLNLVLAT